MPTNIMPTSKFIHSWSALKNKVLVGSEFFRFRLAIQEIQKAQKFLK